jgi:hypothetical protein
MKLISQINDKISSLLINDLTIDDPVEMANKFNYFLTSIAQEISTYINPVEDDISIGVPGNSFLMSALPILMPELK